MHRRHPPALPRIWLMTDERLGDGVLAAILALPCGSGVIVRHYATPQAERRRLFRQIRHIARSRGLIVLRAGPDRLGAREEGVHGRHRERTRTGIRTMPVHNASQMAAARRTQADLIFLSPAFTTRSHPGAESLSRSALLRLVQSASAPVILLGGMDGRRARSFGWRGIHGWAGIDAFSGR